MVPLVLHLVQGGDEKMDEAAPNECRLSLMLHEDNPPEEKGKNYYTPEQTKDAY